MVTRTLLHHTLPTNSGRTAAAWLSSLGRLADPLRAVRLHLAIQSGAAACTLASLGDDDGLTVLTHIAVILGCAKPGLP